MTPGIGVAARLVFIAYAGRLDGVPRGVRGWASRRDRLDITARLVVASLYPGGRLLGDNALLVFFENHPLLILTPQCLPETISSEMDARRLLASVLRGEQCSVMEVGGLDGLVRELRGRGYEVYMLLERGPDISVYKPWLRERVAYIIGTASDPPHVEGVAVASIGPYSYLASHVAAFINYLHLYCPGSG